MAGRIPQSDIDEVLTRISIVDVVSDYVALKSSGNGEFKGLCPFHSEKSPSFGVSVTKNLWHCFGCGEGGNVFQFLNKIDSLTFVEAMEKLAAKVGYQLHYEEGRPDDGSSAIRARVLEANAATAAYFQSQLDTADAEPGRDFLKQRGFDKAAADKFGVGWAPKGWTNLADHLKTLGFTEEELVTAALVSKRENGGVYDKFRGRLIWPIRDAANAVIGFGARKIFSDDEGPKYLNTSETPVYHKSQVLYGIDLAKRDMGKLQQVVVVEGYTDVMACHLAGVTTAVATCGTAFGDEHVKVINRILVPDPTKPAEIIFNFDPDEAGQKAAMRAFSLSGKFNAISYIAIGPEGLDPCDLRKERGDAAIQSMIAAKRPLVAFAIERAVAVFDLNTREGQVAAVRAAAPIVAGISDAVLRSSYEKHLSEITTVDRSSVNQVVAELLKGNRRQAVTGEAPAAPVIVDTNLPNVDLRDPINRRERWLIECVAQAPELITKDELTRITRIYFSHPRHRAIAAAMLKNFGTGNFIAAVEQDLPAELQANWREVLLSHLPVSPENVEAKKVYVRGVVEDGLLRSIELEKQVLISGLGRANAAGSEAEALAIQKKLVEVDKELHTLRAKR